MIDLVIDDLVLPIDAKHDIEQSYEIIEPSTIHRMRDGTGVKQNRWKKLRTTISATGWVPTGLSAIDPNQPVVLKCIGERAISSTTSTVTMPTGYRTDGIYSPRGYAIVDGEVEETSVSISLGIATLDAVVDAVGYTVIYYPEITVYANYSDDFTLSDARFSWTLECEEV